MPVSESITLQSRTAAWTSLGLVTVLTIALTTHPPLTGESPAFGPFIDCLLAPFPLALGFASFPALIGMLAVTVM